MGTDFGDEVQISYRGTVIGICPDSFVHFLEKRSGTTDWLPLTSKRIDIEKPNDHRVLNQDIDKELLSASVDEGPCPYISSNPFDVVELCDLVIREGEDRFKRSLKSRRKNKTGKRKGKNERSNAEALRSLTRVRRKNKKYVKSITHRVFVS